MPKVIVSIDGAVVQEVALTKARITLGRRPYNDIVIDNLAVSGEHAVLHTVGGEVFLEDLNSTNGSYVNGQAVKKQLLHNGDSIDVGKSKITFVDTGGVAAQLTEKSGNSGGLEVFWGSVKVLSGAAAGREVALTKVVTTLGKPGVAVAAITRRHHGFFIQHVEGKGDPALNGVAIGSDPVALKNGDLIELAGTHMQFIQT